MPTDHIRYDILAQDALRSLVRGVLTDAAKRGLPGDHHFFITFETKADGVRLSPRLLEQYPEEMTVVLQHQYWDLKVTDDAFEVGLSFGGTAERLHVPFSSIKTFVDPSVKFALQFETIAEAQDVAPAPTEAAPEKNEDTAREQAKGGARPSGRHEPSRTSVPNTPAPAGPQVVAGTDQPAGETADNSGAEIVSLDRFRKK